jgi:tRNA(Ile)-lysidine synthase
VAVAASGGRDSTALLHCTGRSGRALGIEVVALHVHHGLSAHADEWMLQVRGQCRRWGLGFASARLQGQPAPGDSVEAWARRERWRALAGLARETGCSLVLLAQHRRDQAETWMLQALRGGGAAGLSAMPTLAEREGLVWARPWLALPREAVEAYLRRHRLHHVDDDSNTDTRYARNRLRLQVWPALVAAFPAAETALAAAATQAQEAAALAIEIEALDLPALMQGGSFAIEPWLALPPARRGNALRAWLKLSLGPHFHLSLLRRLSVEMAACRSGRWPAGPGLELRLHRGHLFLGPAQEPVALEPPPQVLDLPAAGTFRLPAWAGHFRVLSCVAGGVAVAHLRGLTARARGGGEGLALAPRSPARSLKKQYQARGTPPWCRTGPLLWTAQGALLFVPGLGIDARLQAPAGLEQVAIEWVPDLPPASGAGELAR